MPDAVRSGNSGPLVLQLQYLLSEFRLLAPEHIDGIFGDTTERAVKDFQEQNGLTVDGIVGPRTWETLHSFLDLPPLLQEGSSGRAVATLQRALNQFNQNFGSEAVAELAADGQFGPKTRQSVQVFQSTHGLTIDGAVGLKTWAAPLGVAGLSLGSFSKSLGPLDTSVQDADSPADGAAGGAPAPVYRDAPVPAPASVPPGVVPPPTGAPVSGGDPGAATSGYDEMVAVAMEEMVRPGRLEFNPPDRMQLGHTERIEIRLARSLDMDEALQQELKGRGVPQLEEVPVAPIMAVTLKGDAFKIAAYSDEEQGIPPGGIAEWAFDICALKRGRQQLAMCVSLRIPLPGTQREQKSIPVREKTIDVEVSVPALVGHFVTSNWQWLIVAVAGLAGVITAWETLLR